ncbi:MAG: hypothetical protein AUI10_11635 [Actinobacteria bacterium 13_2_20CM_2_72_6]|nr:MAG: hypothetical protein AUI10_11635 [Actinobacteria bacterium 13_2_20CM_2_72_6]
MRAELNEGLDHLRQAAAHAAGGMGAAVGPKWDSAKGHLPPTIGKARYLAANGIDTTMAAFAPLLEAARTGAETATKKARKAGKYKAGTKESGMSRKRTTMLVGLLAAGAAAGAAGAMVARRRNRAKWDEYERQGIQSAREGAKSMLDNARSTMDAGAQRIAGTAERAKDAVSSWTDSPDSGHASTKETANLFADQNAQGAHSATEPGKSKTDQFADKAATISKNSRS